MAKLKKVKVDTLEALAVAIVAYRANGRRIVREISGNNKEIIYTYFTTDMGINKQELEEARELAEHIRSSLSQRVMMNGLTGVHNSDFLTTVSALCQQETVTSDKFGIVAWAPKLFDDTVQSDNDREQLLILGINSEYIGQVSKKINFTYNEVMCKYLNYYNSFAHYGHDGQGNLIKFICQNRIPNNSKISAKVKSHTKDAKLGNSQFTVVNYVKVVDEK